jgi:hypothetical protein
MGGANRVVGGGTTIRVELGLTFEEEDELIPERNEAAGTGMGANMLAAFLAFLLAPGIPIPARSIVQAVSIFLIRKYESKQVSVNIKARLSCRLILNDLLNFSICYRGGAGPARTL